MTEQTRPIGPEPLNYQDLLDRDSHPVPDIIRNPGVLDMGPLEAKTEWYLSRAVHDQEIERIWKRSWQMVCREEDIPEVGDTWVYEITNVSLVIVRNTASEVKAYYNSCLHRGRALRDCPGRVTQLKCPYHGFTWDLDGNLRGVPAREEFPQIVSEEFKLPEAKVAFWGGFVFINMDLESESLESFIGTLPDHFVQWPLDERTKTLHIRKVMPCNWKLAHEAFLEAFHVNTTHPQFLPTAGEQFHRMDVFGNFSRSMLGTMMPSAHMRVKPSNQEIFNASVGVWDDEEPLVQISEGAPLRPMVAGMFREQVRPILGDKVDSYSDAEMVDVVSFSLFPNLVVFAGFMGQLCYRFYPHGNSHEECVMEVMVLAPKPPGAPSTPAEVRWLTDEESFMAAPGLGLMAPVLNQDTETLSHIMNGVRNNKRGKVVFSKYHELMLRHFYEMYQAAMGFETTGAPQHA